MKMFKKLVALMLVLIMSVCVFAACGKKDDSNSSAQDDTTVTDTTTTTPPTTKEPEPKEDAAAEKVAAYIEEQRPSFEGSLTNEYGKCEVLARGTIVVYSFHYTVDVNADASTAVQEMLDSEEYVEQYSQLLASMKIEEPAVTAITVEYFDKNGNKLAARTYTK